MNRSIVWAGMLLAASSVMIADTIQSSGGGGWTSMPDLASTPTGTGPFWNNNSLDGHDMNVGYFLTGTAGSCSPGDVAGPSSTGSTCPQNYHPSQYYAQSAGGTGAVSDFNFAGDTGGIQVALLAGFASKDASGNIYSGNMGTSFGYYNADAANQTAAISSEVALYGSGSIAGDLGTSQDVTPYSDYGLYATVCQSTIKVGSTYICNQTYTFFSNTAFNTGDGNHQHFALFSQANNYYIGFEDGLANNPTEGYGDFNDIILELTPQNNDDPPPSVPEPATFGLMGLGLAGLGLGRRSWGKRLARASR